MSEPTLTLGEPATGKYQPAPLASLRITGDDDFTATVHTPGGARDLVEQVRQLLSYRANSGKTGAFHDRAELRVRPFGLSRNTVIALEAIAQMGRKHGIDLAIDADGDTLDEFGGSLTLREAVKMRRRHPGA